MPKSTCPLIRLFTLILTVPWFLVGCASIELSQVEPEKLSVEIEMVAQDDRQNIGISLSRGIWSQSVTLDNPQDASIETLSGDYLPLVAARKDGNYSVTLTQDTKAVRFLLEGIGEVNLPELNKVTLADKGIIEGQAFFKSDQITLALNASQADIRYLVFSTQCGGIDAQTTINLSKDAHEYYLTMSDVIRRLNNSAEADLTGMLAIQMQLVEGAIVNWPAPFEAEKLIALDHTDFFIDTSGFKLSGSIKIQPSEMFSLLFTNRQWPVTYCY